MPLTADRLELPPVLRHDESAKASLSVSGQKLDLLGFKGTRESVKS